MKSIQPIILQLKRLICYFLGYRWTQERRDSRLYTGCARCRKLKRVDPLVFTRRREKTAGDIERWMAENAPEGYSFVDCNWGKRKAKFVGLAGQLEFVNF